MNLGQMLMVLLAVVLFSTIIVSIYHNMIGQIDMAEQGVYFEQVIKVADLLFQHYESVLLGGELEFHDMYTELESGVTISNIAIGEAVYSVTMTSAYCDSTGGMFLIPPVPPPPYQMLVVEMEVETPKRTYHFDADLADDRFAKIFTNMGIMTH